jgi:hypothetical protein
MLLGKKRTIFHIFTFCILICAQSESLVQLRGTKTQSRAFLALSEQPLHQNVPIRKVSLVLATFNFHFVPVARCGGGVRLGSQFIHLSAVLPATFPPECDLPLVSSYHVAKNFPARALTWK